MPGLKFYFPLLYLTVPTVWLEKSLYYSTHPLPRKPALFLPLFLLLCCSSCFKYLHSSQPLIQTHCSESKPAAAPPLLQTCTCLRRHTDLHIGNRAELKELQYFPTVKVRDTLEPSASKPCDARPLNLVLLSSF